MTAADADASFVAYLNSVADRVTVALDHLLPRPTGPEARLMSAMRYSALAGGKRLRPFLTIEAGRMFDADERSLLRIGAAIECVHAYSLIHDDLPCMDDDDLRRGQPTTHKAFDEATALLAGDALLTCAFEILVDPETHPDPQMRCRLIQGLAHAAGAGGMVGGQMIDMDGHSIADDMAAIARMQRLKTGALIQYSVDAGAQVGAASDEQRQALARFAHDLGIAFQIADDLIDAEGVEDEAGKRVRKDSARGKPTFVALIGADAARERVQLLAQQAREHLSIFGSRAFYLAQSIDFVAHRRN